MHKKVFHNPIFVTMLVLGTFLMGIISFWNMQFSVLPPTTYPALSIETEYYGVGPEKIEKILTKPIEESVATIGGIEKIFSSSEEGKSKVNIEFEKGTDLDIKSMEIRDKLDLIASTFPREVHKPVLINFDPTQKPFLIVSLDSKQFTDAKLDKKTKKSKKKLSLFELRIYAERELKQQIKGVKGVSEVFVIGGRVKEVMIACDLQSMLSYQVSMDDITKVLQAANMNFSAGVIKAGGSEYPLYIKGRFTNLKNIENTVIVANQNGRVVYLKDVATIKKGFRDRTNTSRVNGEEKVSLYIHKTVSSNLLKMADGVETILKNNLSESITYEIIYNQAKVLKDSLTDILLALGLGFILLTIYLFLIYKTILVPGILLVQFFVLFFTSCFIQYILGIHYDLINLSAIIISFTFIVYLTFIQNEKKSFQKVKTIFHNSRKVLLSILIIYGTLLPVIFLDQETKEIYQNMVYTTILYLGLFFLVYHSLVPLILFNAQKKKIKQNNIRIPLVQIPNKT
ncbi:MAG: efflux RND transporter permease subunit, partial [Spirochaetota bacterium]